MPIPGVNRVGVTCPVCMLPACTEHVALLPHVIKGEIHLPDEYAVCPSCYYQQFEQKYGFKYEDRPPSTPAGEWE